MARRTSRGRQLPTILAARFWWEATRSGRGGQGRGRDRSERGRLGVAQKNGVVGPRRRALGGLLAALGGFWRLLAALGGFLAALADSRSQPC
jgi:hypothetical protein